MTDRESLVYGMSTADIREEYMNGITARCSGLEMVVMGVLSDAQELLSFVEARHDADDRTKEQVRKQMNIAKFILSEMMEAKERV